MKFKNIFITGSTGVVGKPLLKKLIENGHNVYGLSRSDENKKNLESKGVSVISGNILTSNLIDQFENIDIGFFSTGTWDPKKEKEIFQKN